MKVTHSPLDTISHPVVHRVGVVMGAVVVRLVATGAAGPTNNHLNMEEVTITSLQATTLHHRAIVSRASTVRVAVRNGY